MEKLTLYVGRFKGVDAIFAFLHEIGHLNNREDMGIIYRLEQAAERERRIDRHNDYPNSRLKALAEERKWLLRIERDAWAFALRKIRELERKHGVSVFARVEGEGKVWENIRDLVNQSLETHEQIYLDELYQIDIYSKEEMEELFNSLV